MAARIPQETALLMWKGAERRRPWRRQRVERGGGREEQSPTRRWRTWWMPRRIAAGCESG